MTYREDAQHEGGAPWRSGNHEALDYATVATRWRNAAQDQNRMSWRRSRRITTMCGWSSGQVEGPGQEDKGAQRFGYETCSEEQNEACENMLKLLVEGRACDPDFVHAAKASADMTVPSEISHQRGDRPTNQQRHGTWWKRGAGGEQYVSISMLVK